MMDDYPFVSVVVPTYNRGEVLKLCIDSLLKQTCPEDRYEIIVVDDGSNDSTKDVIESYSREHNNLSYIRQENKGSYAARNYGIMNARGEIICFTDDDCIADEDWINKIVESYDDDDIGGVGGRIASYPPQTLAERYSEEIDLLNQKELSKVYLMTANASYRRNIIGEVKGFDDFFRSSGDADCGIRVTLRGYKLAYNQQAIVYHKHRQTFKSLIKQKYFHGRGYASLHKKYPQNFNPKMRILSLSYKVLIGLMLYPLMLLKSFFIKDRLFYLTKRLMDIVLIIAHSIGIMSEALFGGGYPGEKIDKKLDFIEKAGITGGWGL